jgi:hypothetical protein
VALTAYTLNELRSVIHYSVNTLTQHGFHHATSFRAGGWQANRTVLTALADEGFTLDASATDSRYLDDAWRGYNLPSFVHRLWPSISPSSQPYTVALNGSEHLVEPPNNGCLADYVTGDDMLQAFITNAGRLRTSPAQDVYLSIGFHQETAAEYLPHVRDAIEQIADYASRNDIPYEFILPTLQ